MLKSISSLKFIVILVILCIGDIHLLLAEKPNRVGTTTANFLEIGFGPRGIAMGDAYASAVTDLSAVYWNPAGLAFMESNEAQFMLQPWLVNSKLSFVAVGVPITGIGTLALNIIHMGYGDMEVTTLSSQDGTGELFDANEMAITLSYGRGITDWFAFGAGVKYVSSQIWHVSGSAIAFDLGVIVKTGFLPAAGRSKDGLRIGMSISNYGTKMRYDGTDLLNPIDISPDENGNFRDAPGQFRLNSWELPLIFRVGVSVKPIVIENHSVTLAVDALHPNNNSESVNLGMEYSVNMPAFGQLFLRGGYKALFLEYSEFGPTVGGGFSRQLLGNIAIQFDYAYRDIGILGSVNCFGLGIQF